MKKLLLFCFLIVPLLSNSQVTIALQDFEVSPATPTLSYTTSGTGGSLQTGTTGTGDRPASANKFFDGARGYGTANGSTFIVFGPINVTNYVGVNFSVRLASYSVGSNGNGADAADLVEISVSQDGTTYSNELSIGGNTNACWNFSATGNATTAYDGNNSATAFVAPGGGLITTGFSNPSITNLPISTTLYLRVRLLNNSANELWLIDQAKLTGTPASPTITANPTTIPLFNYTLGNGPSSSNSYNLSGSVLTPSADTIKIFAPTNFEISKTAGSGFKDSLNILYSGSAFASTPIYARLKAGLAENTYSDTIRHSGGGVILANGPKVKLSGTVTTVPPPVITATGTLTAFSTFVGGNSTPQSYIVSGVYLTSDVVINAPAGYEIKTGMGAYSSSLTLPQVSGNVGSTTIDVRLKGTATGTFAGNIIHTSAGVTPNVNVAVTGTVGAACGTATNIGTVRAPIPEQKDYSGPIVTIAGRVTARFGTPKFYLQDATGGIAIYSTLNGGVAQANNIALGDSIILTGQAYRAFGEAEIFNPTCVNKISTGTSPAPIIFDSNNPPSGINLPTFLDNNEGRLVKVLSANLSNTGSFASASNYPLTACNLQGDIEIRIDGTANTITSQPIPTVSQDITGVIGHYIPNATVSILQLFPRTISDFTNSSIACITPVASPSASCGPLGSKSIPADSTLDVTCWNVEWLGNTTLTPSPLGPTNDAQQMINVMSVLKNVKSDVFCIEEVCDHRKFIDSVKVNLPKYKVRCQTKYFSHFFDSPENPADAKTFSQKICFVYDSTVVTMVDTISLLPSQYGYDAPLPLPTPYPNNWASGRLPFLFIGDVKVGGITKQIHFVGLHAKSGSAVADYNRRKQDVIDLKTKLDTSYPNANIIMLGDYNDDLDTSIAAGKASSYANFVTDNVNYKQISRALSLCGVSSTAKYPDIIDHFLMSNEFGVLPASGATPSPSLSGIYYLENTINVTRPINYVANYTTTTSDHYPVNARFTFKLPSEIISVNSGNWSSPSTWSCNCVPSSSSNVTIDTAHTVTVDVASQVRSLNVKGTINWVASIMLSLGQ
jgi:hypothetical protein